MMEIVTRILVGLGERCDMRKETGFNEIIRKVRKELFGKGPERIHTTFVDNMAITMLYGNLTPSEKFLAQEVAGKEMVHAARTKMVQKIYPVQFNKELEDYMDSRLLHLFSDIKVEEDIAISVFVFEDTIVAK